MWNPVRQAEILRQQSELRDKRHELTKLESQARTRQNALATAEAEDARVASLLSDAETLHDLAQAIEGQFQPTAPRTCALNAILACTTRPVSSNNLQRSSLSSA
jgi:hypothetical protein